MFGRIAIVSGWGFDRTPGCDKDSWPYIHSDLRQASIKIREDCDQTTVTAGKIFIKYNSLKCSS